MEGAFGHEHYAMIDETTRKEVPHQLSMAARGCEMNLLVTLNAKEQRSYRIEERPAPAVFATSIYAPAVDCVNDLHRHLYRDPDWAATPFDLITPYLKIKFQHGKGIVSVYDRRDNRELIRSDCGYAAFTPIYEVTPAKEDYYGIRHRMGRNRKAVRTQRTAGVLTDAAVTEFGEVFAKVQLTYELPGTNLCVISLTAYKDLPKIDITLRLHKQSVWDPENLYLAMPFTTGEREEIWIDKTGALLRPRVDQIPGSCADFYSVQNGVYFVGENDAVILSMPDTPLIAMGTPEARPVCLSGEEGVNNRDEVYSWVMNNFWETNFKVCLGGFHEYNYTLRLADTANPVDCLRIAKEENTGVLSFRGFDV
jgi:hypothetical protein